MKLLAIRSKGEIEPEAISLMGASTKRGDSSKIGMFGSGNKFALAFFMRSGLTPRIYSGTREIKISSVRKLFRNEPFETITVDGAETSLTTAMGKDWDCWMAIREVYANALDEGEATIECVTSVRKKAGYTTFYIPMNEEVQEFYDNIGDYFSTFRTPIYQNENGQLFPSEGKTVLYRKGIRCFHQDSPSMFNYNIPDILITEDRTVRWQWHIGEAMYKLIASMDSLPMIKTYLSLISDPSYYESDPSNSTISFANAPPIWDEAMKGLYFCPAVISGFVKESERGMTTFISGKVHAALEARFGKNILPPSLRGQGSTRYKLITASDQYSHKISKAVAFLKFAGINVDQYPVHLGEFSNKDILAEAEPDTQSIVLSDRLMTMGQKVITQTLIEEYLHLKTGARDETRDFQNASLNLCTTLMEQIVGEEL